MSLLSAPDDSQIDIIDQDMMGWNVRIYTPSDQNIRFKMILIHGGCFSAGDHTWNAEQASRYAKAIKAKVYVPDFPQYTTTSTRIYLRQLVEEIKGQFPIIVVGTSSGGYHALWLACQKIVSTCFAFCPVADPYARYLYLSSSTHPNRDIMMSQQLNYFKSVAKMQLASEELQNMIIETPTVVVKVQDDINVPPEVLTAFLAKQPNVYIETMTSGGHQECFKDSKILLDVMIRALSVRDL
jgi:homoserine acetyltransferase